MKRSQQDIRRASQVFKALSHPQRLRVACLLIDQGAMSQKQLVEELGLPQSTVARLLEPLRNTGLVVGLRQGPELSLSVQGEVLTHMLDSMCGWLHDKAAREAEEDEMAGRAQ